MDSENPMPEGFAESTDQLDWLAHFQSQTKDLDIKARKHEEGSCPDEIQIQIEDMENKISELRAQLRTHIKNGGITKDESREMKDLIEKYSVKLDNIDFTGRTDALTGRRIELIDIILKIQKKLQGLTNIENQSKNRTGLIVEVKEGKLETNESAIQNLLQLCSENNYTDKYWFHVLSIVGERKSGKSRLFESFQNHAVGMQWQVLALSEGILECSGINCRVLCVDEMGRRRLIFLMDVICDQSCNSEIYTKLVDFCIHTSGVVFYTEKKELDLFDPGNPCYWNVDGSLFKTSSLCESSTLNNPYVFMFTHDWEFVEVGQVALLQVRSDRIRERKRQKEASQHSLHSIAVSLEEYTQESSCIFPNWTSKTDRSSTNETKLYDKNLFDFLQEVEFFQRCGGDDMDFGAVERNVKLFEESTNIIEREFLASTDRCLSSGQHSAVEDTTLFSIDEEDVKPIVKKALEKYDNYMRCQTEQQIFTDSKIQEFHDHAHSVLTAETVLPRFEKRQLEDYLRLVNAHLGERRQFFIIQNQTRIREKAKVRKVHLEEGKTMYKVLLTRYPASYSYDDFVHSARTFAWALYEKKAKGKYLNVAAWKNAFLSKVDALNQQILVDKISIKIPQIRLEDFSIEFRKLELCVKEEDTLKGSVSLVFHLTPSSLQAAVFIVDSKQRRDIKSEWNSPVFRDHWPPCILFRAGGPTLIGNEALNSEQISGSGSFFNVYEMLRRGSQGEATVVMNKKEETLEVEEIVAMFIFKIKRQIETELNIHLTSAAFAMCSLFSTTAKHMVKTSLSLGGFQHSVLLESRAAAVVGEHVLGRDSGWSQSSILLLHDETEIIQLCILGNDQNLKVKAFSNLMSTRISTAYMKETITRNLREIGHRPTSAIIMPMSPLCQQPPSQTQRRLTTALTELKESNRDLENCEILIKNVDECRILLGAHFYCNPTSDEMKGIRMKASKCNVFVEIKKLMTFGFFRPASVYEFSNDSEFFSITKKPRMVLNIKMSGKDELYIRERGVGGPEDSKVATLTRINQDDRKEIEIQIYLSSEGLLDFQLKSQGAHSEVVDVRAQEEVQIVTKYLLPQQVEAAKNKLSKYFKTRKIKIEDSWKTFVKNTDSMSTMGETCSDSSDLENSHSLSFDPQIKTEGGQSTI